MAIEMTEVKKNADWYLQCCKQSSREYDIMVAFEGSHVKECDR